MSWSISLLLCCLFHLRLCLSLSVWVSLSSLAKQKMLWKGSPDGLRKTECSYLFRQAPNSPPFVSNCSPPSPSLLASDFAGSPLFSETSNVFFFLPPSSPSLTPWRWEQTFYNTSPPPHLLMCDLVLGCRCVCFTPVPLPGQTAVAEKVTKPSVTSQIKLCVLQVQQRGWMTASLCNLGAI